MIFFLIHSSLQEDIQAVKCNAIQNYGGCEVNGKEVRNSTKILILTTIPNYSQIINFIDFGNFENTLINNSYHINKWSFKTSNVTLRKIENYRDDETFSITFYSSNVSLLNDGLSTYKILKYIGFYDCKINGVESGAFEGVEKIQSISLTNTEITEEMIIAMGSLTKLDSFECRKCKIDDSKFSKILDGPKMSEVMVSDSIISSLDCSRISPMKIKNGNFDYNSLNQTVATCGIKIFSVTKNQIDILHIQNDTEKIYAANNSISSIICDRGLILTVLVLNFNKLSDLQCISNISNLEELSINSNNFTIFKSEDFSKLSKLRIVSAIGNNFTYFLPNMFSSGGQNNQIFRISIDRFDFGYEYLRKIYPQLKELFHVQFKGNCEEYFKRNKFLLDQNISYYFLKTVPCK